MGQHPPAPIDSWALDPLNFCLFLEAITLNILLDYCIDSKIFIYGSTRAYLEVPQANRREVILYFWLRRAQHRVGMGYGLGPFMGYEI